MNLISMMKTRRRWRLSERDDEKSEKEDDSVTLLTTRYSHAVHSNLVDK